MYDEDGTLVGQYTADLLLEGQLIVELKACHTLTTEHFAWQANQPGRKIPANAADASLKQRRVYA